MPAEIAAAAVMAKGRSLNRSLEGGGIATTDCWAEPGRSDGRCASSFRQPWVRRQPGTRTEGKRIEQPSRGRFPREPANDWFSGVTAGDTEGLARGGPGVTGWRVTAWPVNLAGSRLRCCGLR